MNRELKIIFDENDINVPFPQVTVSQLEEKSKDKSTKVSHKEVEAFVKEQREISKDIEDKQ